MKVGDIKLFLALPESVGFICKLQRKRVNDFIFVLFLLHAMLVEKCLKRFVLLDTYSCDNWNRDRKSRPKSSQSSAVLVNGFSRTGYFLVVFVWHINGIG